MERGIYYTHHDSDHFIKLVGELRFNQSQALEHLIEVIEQDTQKPCLKIDLTETKFLDSTMLGMIGRMGLLFTQEKKSKPILYCQKNDVRKGIEVMGLGQLFELTESPIKVGDLEIVPVDSEDKESLRERVIKAHEVLIKIDGKNREQFDTLINQLEKKGQ